MNLSEKEKRNQQRYRQAFSSMKIPASVNLNKETKNMNYFWMGKKMAAAAAAALVLMTGAGVYASDLGGVRSAVSGWFEGEKEDFEAVPNGGHGYDFYKQGEDEPEFGGSGVEIDRFGNETPLSAQDVLENRAVDVRIVDGKVLLDVYERTFNISQWCQEGETAYFKASVEGKPLYLKVEIEEEGSRISLSTGNQEFSGIKDYIELD